MKPEETPPPPTLTFTSHRTSYPAIDPLNQRNAHLSMSGRTVLVTGASRSIGAAIAQSFAQAGAADIVILSRSKAALDTVAQNLQSQYPNTKVHVYTLDLSTTTPHGCQELFKSITVETGVTCIDTLVLNAGHVHDHSEIAGPDFLLDDFWKCYEINVRGNLNLTKAFLALPTCPKDATIIYLTSVLGYAPSPRWRVSGYGSSKAAFMKVLDYFHAERPELRIFNVHPGWVPSEMSDKAGLPMNLDPSYYDEAELPANFCVWLASPKADFLIGRTLESSWDVNDIEKVKDTIIADPRLFRIGLQGQPYVPRLK